MNKVTTHQIEFEFPYTLNGGEASTFECRCVVRVDWGQRPIYYPPPGDPGSGPMVEEVSGLEVSAGRAGWCIPDPALAQRIYDYLSTPNMESWLIDKAREDK